MLISRTALLCETRREVLILWVMILVILLMESSIRDYQWDWSLSDTLVDSENNGDVCQVEEEDGLRRGKRP